MTGTPYTSKLWSGLRMAANVNLFFLTDTRVAVKVQYIMACSLMLQTVSSAVYESSMDCKNDFEMLLFFFLFFFIH